MKNRDLQIRNPHKEGLELKPHNAAGLKKVALIVKFWTEHPDADRKIAAQKMAEAVRISPSSITNLLRNLQNASDTPAYSLNAGTLYALGFVVPDPATGELFDDPFFLMDVAFGRKAYRLPLAYPEGAQWIEKRLRPLILSQMPGLSKAQRNTLQRKTREDLCKALGITSMELEKKEVDILFEKTGIVPMLAIDLIEGTRATSKEVMRLAMGLCPTPNDNESVMKDADELLRIYGLEDF